LPKQNVCVIASTRSLSEYFSRRSFMLVFLYLIAFPIALYTKPFSSQGEAYLCLTQALRPDIEDPSSWLTRGFKAFARRLEELKIHVSPRTIIFAINMKVLKGEHFEVMVRKRRRRRPLWRHRSNPLLPAVPMPRRRNYRKFPASMILASSLSVGCT
jgi:hypothetical protein